MSTTFTRDLDPLSSSGLELEDPAQDLRGRAALDRDGESIGTVADMMIDPGLRLARMLVIEQSGILGLGKKQYLVPLEVARPVDDGSVMIDRTKDEVQSAPEYHASEGEEEELHYADVYATYGVRPYWEAETPAGPAETPAPPPTDQPEAR
jgi:sporulation protein YlmC with PRC-barrel domain